MQAHLPINMYAPPDMRVVRSIWIYWKDEPFCCLERDCTEKRFANVDTNALRDKALMDLDENPLMFGSGSRRDIGHILANGKIIYRHMVERDTKNLEGAKIYFRSGDHVFG